MLFNSSIFILMFLPVTLTGFFLLGLAKRKATALVWLVFVSIVFYGFFRVDYLFLFAVLTVFNFMVGKTLAYGAAVGRRLGWLAAFGITVNLCVLVYFKYTNFLVDNFNFIFGQDYLFRNIIMPIGISFFVFQKIAYIVDSYKGNVAPHGFLDFALFVSFFPQLVAGPIVHHKEIMPQFERPEIFRFSSFNISTGLLLFMMGLAKKIVIADQMAVWSDAYFAASANGAALTFFEAWLAALSFTFQIYFDFSGYTDMALGLAIMFGVRLPMNFNSPYKALSIIDFWRRWHMTLSRFLRDYVYIPLGGSRRGRFRQYINLLLTMLIGGLWHGAAWTFVAWGAIHGGFLILNHAWNYAKRRIGLRWGGRLWDDALSCAVVFVVVVFAWVFFRAETFSSAANLVAGMTGLNGIVLPSGYSDALGVLAVPFQLLGWSFDTSSLKAVSVWDDTKFLVIAGLLGMVWLLPNSQQLVAFAYPTLEPVLPAARKRLWHPLIQQMNRVGLLQRDGTIAVSTLTGALVGGLMFACLAYQALRSVPMQSFIYFQF